LKIVIPLYAKSIENQSFVTRKNKSAIMLDFLEHPFSSFQERYRKNKASKNNTFTKNWRDARKYYLELVLGGCIKELSFNKKAYVEPVPKELKKYRMTLDKYEKIFSLIKENPHVLDNDFFLEFCASQGLVNLSEFKKSRMKMSLIDYNYSIDLTQSFKKQMFSKFFKIFLIEGLNFDTATKKLKNNKKIFPYEKIDFRLDTLNRIIENFEKFLIKYDLPDSVLLAEYGIFADILDIHYRISEKCYYLIGHRLGREQKNSIRKRYKDGDSIGFLHKMYRRSRKQISNIVKGKS